MNNNRKNDSFPQKNVSLNATQLPREPQTHASGESSIDFVEQAEFSPFNKTSLIGVGVLVIAMVSVAIPYSLGWFSTSAKVAESSGADPENLLENNTDPQYAPLEYTANKVDDSFPDLSVDDSNLLDALDDFSKTSVAQMEPVLETTGGDELLDIPELEEEATEFEELSLTQSQTEPDNREAFNPLPKLPTPSRTEPVPRETPNGDHLSGKKTAADTPRSPSSPSPASLSTAHSPNIQPRVDPSAINAETTFRKATPQVANYNPNPDTTHPIDEIDSQVRESANNAIVRTNYTSQAFTETSGSDFSAPQSLQNLRREYRPKYAQVRQGSRSLPNTHGQLWCEYDITPFTKAPGIVPGSLPEQILVKWIRRQTGEEAWHSEPFGILSATTDTLYVYHTPEVQEQVAEIVDRFVNPKGESDAYTFRIVSLNGPNWLTPFHANLKPIRIDTAGAQGWLTAKEDYARMIPELARRSDYRELCSPQFSIKNGREYVVSANVPKNYTSDVLPQDNVWPGYVSETTVINEGYSMSLLPLSGVDGVSADLMVKCESIQVEKMHTVAVNVPSQVTSRQRVAIESPQIVHFQLDEQIRWPKDKVLILSLGTIPIPSATQPNDGKLIPELSRKISGSPAARGHVLLFVECRTQ
ncbi:MAG: hypothetical protein FWC43_14490 [Planctomycetaceae bacterium]|nr:hypothetical protein [Planctomycetaceae bacterium]